ncbi:MAG TPA: hypothetical protein VNM47_14620 [Terriglobia bacterium]|nr:hypothetical protein [Terriglobia bacterium]
MLYKKRLKSVLNSIAEGASYRVFVANNSANRKVLIVADEPSIKNLLALVRRLENRRVVTAGARPDLSTISRRSFDTAILDLRCAPRQPAGRGYGIGEVWPNMVGRVLVINAEVSDQKTFGLVEKYIRQRHTLRDLLYSLADLARTVIGRSPSPHRI